jgi:LytS/YehU family sensor histidine kinase
MKTGNKLYWFCQIVGWGTYSTVGLSTAVIDHGWRPSAVYGYILFFLYNIGLTHLLRYTFHRRNWAALPLPGILVRLAIASLVIGAIQASLVVGIYTAIEGSMGVWKENGSIVFLYMGVSIATAIWSTLYLTVTTMRNSREMRRREAQMKRALGDAELRVLEKQLNPHFLFNCLNSIRGMIVEDASLAQDMVTRLANILRYSLQPDRSHTVMLDTELEAVTDYLALESIRFEDRMSVHVDVPEEVRRIRIPAMLLQTLVENAIKHGIEQSSQHGSLSIRAVLHEAQLRIEVENTGHLNPRRSASTQVGLANARERLRILYADRASLTLSASGQEFVKATILIPANS